MHATPHVVLPCTSPPIHLLFPAWPLAHSQVSPLDRTIVIDTQPIFSPHALAALMDPKAAAAVSSEPGTVLAEAAGAAFPLLTTLNPP